MAYEIYSRKVRKAGSPQIAIMAKGRLSFNKASTSILKEQAVEFVLLLWDKTARKIGVRPIAKKDPRAYKISVRESSAGFSAKTFLEDIGVPFERTQIFPLSWNAEQGIFEFALSEGTMSNRQSPKGKQKDKQPLLSVAGAR